MLTHLKSFAKHGLYTVGWCLIFNYSTILIDKVIESRFKEEWPRFRKQRREERNQQIDQQSSKMQDSSLYFRKMKLEKCPECDHLMIPLPDKVDDLDNPDAYLQRCIGEDCKTGIFNRAFLIKSGIQLHKQDLPEELQ